MVSLTIEEGRKDFVTELLYNHHLSGLSTLPYGLFSYHCWFAVTASGPQLVWETTINTYQAVSSNTLHGLSSQK